MKLLLAIDIHSRRQLTFDDAAAWARKIGSTLDLVYVHAYGSNLEMRDDMERSESEARAQLRSMLEKIPEENRGKIHLLSGDPASVISELAASFDAVLVATHGRTGLAHLWMGSVAEQIVRRAPVPVIVLRLGASVE